jgi:hypothetical protein
MSVKKDFAQTLFDIFIFALKKFKFRRTQQYLFISLVKDMNDVAGRRQIGQLRHFEKR